MNTKLQIRLSKADKKALDEICTFRGDTYSVFIRSYIAKTYISLFGLQNYLSLEGDDIEES